MYSTMTLTLHNSLEVNTPTHPHTHTTQVNMEEEAAAVHALMKANQLSLQMMAAVPALLFGTGVAVALRRLWLWVRNPTAFSKLTKPPN
jgi:hypothetical protein